MVRLYLETGGRRAAAQAFGCAEVTIMAAVKAAGLQPNRVGRPWLEQPSWTRRHRPEGYIVWEWHWRGQRGYIYEHTIVMSRMLGRALLPGEQVHHRNGRRDDNRPVNLELWIKPQPTGVRVQDAVAWAREILIRYGDDQCPPQRPRRARSANSGLRRTVTRRAAQPGGAAPAA